MQVISKINVNALGYNCWLLVDRFGVNDCLLVDQASDQPKVARCHPVIRAERIHAEHLGCEVGDLICGVRWFEPYRGQPVVNN